MPSYSPEQPSCPPHIVNNFLPNTNLKVQQQKFVHPSRGSLPLYLFDLGDVTIYCPDISTLNSSDSSKEKVAEKEAGVTRELTLT